MISRVVFILNVVVGVFYYVKIDESGSLGSTGNGCDDYEGMNFKFQPLKVDQSLIRTAINIS